MHMTKGRCVMAATSYGLLCKEGSAAKPYINNDVKVTIYRKGSIISRSAFQTQRSSPMHARKSERFRNTLRPL